MQDLLNRAYSRRAQDYNRGPCPAFGLAGRARIDSEGAAAGGSTGHFGRESMLSGHIHRWSQSSGPVFKPRTQALMPLPESDGVRFGD